MFCPDGQERLQTPTAQTLPAAQTWPHLPQLLLSDETLVQVPLQSVSPLWQESAHVPAEQTWPFWQTWPHLPQFLLSDETLAQKRAPASPPPHLLCPEGQTRLQAPVTQTCAASQALPQAPQFLGSILKLVQMLPHFSVPGPQTSPRSYLPLSGNTESVSSLQAASSATAASIRITFFMGASS